MKNTHQRDWTFYSFFMLTQIGNYAKTRIPNLSAFLLACIVVGQVNAANVTISNISTNNLGSPDEIAATGNYVVRELRSDIVDTTTVTTEGLESTFSTHFQWFMGHKVIQPEAPNFGLIYLRKVGYEIKFTVNDPDDVGYNIDVNHIIRGIASTFNSESNYSQISAGLLLGRIDDGSKVVLRTGLHVYGGGVGNNGDTEGEYKEKVISYESSFTSQVYYGTRNFIISFSSRPSPGGSSVFQNYGGGENILKFGLAPSHDSEDDPSKPNFSYADDSETEDDVSSEMGHKVNITVTALEYAVEDMDNDGISDEFDNCPLTPNNDQLDFDSDGVGDVCDNCVDAYNPDQMDIDGNGVGDECDYLNAALFIAPKSLNCKGSPKSKAVLPILVLSDGEFEASSIDLNSLSVNGEYVYEKHDRLHLSDIDNDGDVDSTMHLSRSLLCDIFSDASNGDELDLLIEGSLLNGRLFQGESTIEIKKK